jgi:hypothetical protein
MIRVCPSKLAGVVNKRIAQDPRISKAQLDAITSASKADLDAQFMGLDARMRPALRARLSGPNGSVEYALLRNGEPTKVTRPLSEVWR